MKSPKIGSDTGHVFRTEAIPGEGSVPCSLFYDRSVLEVCLGGMVLTLRHYPADPASLQFTQRGLSSFTAWKMKTIWPTATP
jgi:hypothetical protein